MYDGAAIRNLPLMEVGEHLLQASNGTAKKVANASLTFATVQFDFRHDEIKEIAKSKVRTLYVIRHSALIGGFAIGYEAVDTDGKRSFAALARKKNI